MRVIKRFLTRHIGELRNAPRRRTIAAALQTHFALAAPPVLAQSGSRGQDSIYRVQRGDKTLGMLRVVNPFRKRKLPPADMPFISVPPAARVAREMLAYETGAAAGLTPQPVWNAPDALCCAYLPLVPLHGRFMQQPEKAWAFILPVTAALRRLHALGVVHADVSLANTLADDALSQIAFVDFEYAPAPHVSAGAARLYDYLRLVESSWKFIPLSAQAVPQQWLDMIAAAARDEGISAADIAPLLPALSRINDAGVVAQVQKILPQ